MGNNLYWLMARERQENLLREVQCDRMARHASAQAEGALLVQRLRAGMIARVNGGIASLATFTAGIVPRSARAACPEEACVLY